jgi:hypothetical protein
LVDKCDLLKDDMNLLLDITLIGRGALESFHFLFPLLVVRDNGFDELIDRLYVGECLLDLIGDRTGVTGQGIDGCGHLGQVGCDLRDLLLVVGFYCG